MERKTVITPAFTEFFESQGTRAQNKILAGLDVIRTIKVVSSKLAKKLTNTNLYELRISVDNEVRILFVCTDSDNLQTATELILLNGFVKKDTKDYKKQITRAINILNELQQ